MFCRSLRHAGEELLGGVAGYPDFPWTSGIALLHPWANRLGEFGYDGVTLDPDSPDLYVLDGLAAARAALGGDRLGGGREHATPGSSPDASWTCATFPFPHRVEVAAELSERALTLTTTVTAHDRPVPIAFGYHPYFKLERELGDRAAASAERLAVDERLIPTGERAPAGDLDGPLGTRTFDDGYTLAADAGPFVLAGGGRRIEVAFERGYPLRADLRAVDLRRHLLRADDRARRRAAALAGRRGARRVVLRALQRVRVTRRLNVLVRPPRVARSRSV